MNIQDDVAPMFVFGDVLEIDGPATRNRRLIVAEIRQYAGGTIRPMVDYVLEAPQVRLRFVSCKNGVVRPLVLTLFDSLPYNDALLNVVRDESARLTVQGDTDSSNISADIFWRIYDVTDSHISSVNIRSKIGVTDAAIEYWEYSRLTDIEGVETEEFIFVEMNKADGWFQIWRGVEVAAGKIAAA